MPKKLPGGLGLFEEKLGRHGRISTVVLSACLVLQAYKWMALGPWDSVTWFLTSTI